MSILQRIILIVGAMVFSVVLWTSPQVNVYNGAILKARSRSEETLAPIIDINTAAVRGLAVLGATIMFWFAAQGVEIKKRGFELVIGYKPDKNVIY